MSRVLVIGGNGFIGSHLVDSLVVYGHEVTVFDAFDAPPQWDSSGVRTISGNFLNVGDVAEAVKGQRFVVHMLSTTDPATAEMDPTLDVRTNILSSISLFERCAQEGVDRVFFPSTGGAIYGQQDSRSFSEDAPTRPISPYAIGKLAIENYLDYFYHRFGLRSTVFRISNPYGTRQNPRKRQGVIPIFLRQMAQGLPITIMGDGTMVRDYIYVEDVAEIMGRMITEGTPHSLYNLGSGRPTSVNQIVEVMERVTGLAPSILRAPTPPTYVPRVTLDISRLRTDFPGIELTDLETGVRKTWEEMLDGELPSPISPARPK